MSPLTRIAGRGIIQPSEAGGARLPNVVGPRVAARLLVPFALAALALLSASCGRDASALSATPVATGAAASPVRYGGTLVLANRGDPPAGFDSLRTSSIALHHVGGALFGPGNLVMRCREDASQVCAYLAASWSHNTDFTEWSFDIRPGVFWHDGTPFTAADAKFWLDLAYFGARAGEKVRAPAYFKAELGEIERVEAPGPDRLRVVFAAPNRHFVESLANPRFKIAHPRHLMQPRIDAGEVSLSPLDVGLVGLGPFALEKYEPGTIVQVRRFDRYFETSPEGPLPYLDGIDYVVMTEPLAMDIAFRSGRLDGGARGQGHYLSPERKQGYVKDLGDDVVFARIEGGTFRLAFNVLKTGPWQDSRIRRAIALWIDKPAAIPAALPFGWTSLETTAGDGEIRRDFVNWPGFDQAPLESRRAEATMLMAEAGYAGGFRMGHLCRALNPAPCEYLKDQLAGLGIDLTLQMLDEAEWNAARLTLDFDSEQGRLTPPSIPEATVSVYGRYSINPDAFTKHEDASVDALYARLNDAASPEERIARWRDIERYLFFEQTYVIPIAESVDEVAYRSYVRGLAIPMFDGHANTDFSTVWLAK
ncbi:MAG: ABC transporter substrate-binding protein [SAR202 cluster bacterium]|nr:ABC transporter substrate-binding protein [SAR202 cluster bacterium]